MTLTYASKSYLSPPVDQGAGYLVDEVAPMVPADTRLGEALLAQQRVDAREAALDAFERDVFGVER